MKRLYLFVIKSFLGPFLFTLLVAIFVFLMTGLWRYIGDFAGRDLPVSVIFEFLFYFSITTLYMAIPLAILLASIMTLGNMGEHNELIAMKSAGVSLFKILQPLLVVSIILLSITFVINNYISPIAMFRANNLQSDMLNKNPEFLLKEGTFIADMPSATIKVEKVSDKEDGKFYDAIIYEKALSGKLKRTIVAKSGHMKSSKDMRFMTIWLYDGHMYEEEDENEKFPLTRISFDEYMIVTPVKSSELKRTKKNLNKNDYRMLTYRQLDTLIRFAKKDEEAIKNRIYRRTKNRYYFNRMVSEDSLYIEGKYKSVNTDSLFRKMLLTDQNIVYSSALGVAKNIRDYMQERDNYLKEYQTYTAKAEESWHHKFSWPFACIIFFFVGASLGAIVRKGGFGMPVLFSIIIFIAYYMVSKYGFNLFVAKGYLPAYIGGWLSTIIFLIIGVWLSYKATTDSVMMGKDIYNKFAKKITRYRITASLKHPFKRRTDF